MLRIFVVFAIFLTSGSCQRSQSQLQLVSITGTTMGRIAYSIKYYDASGTSLKQEIDSLLEGWNMVLSTYIEDSEISRFNRDSCHTFRSPYFYPVLEASKSVFEASGGAFDPTVGPLVNAWGFGPGAKYDPDSSVIDSLKRFVGFDKIVFDKDKVCKTLPGVQLDFSAIAKGYAVDVVSAYLQSKGVENLLVEIGGEVMCHGTKSGGKPWRTAIEHPAVEVYERKLYAVAEVRDMAIATSGNYRNYYIRNNRKMVHTINPKTGYPVVHSLLSATVFAKSCMIADAYATACMVLGLEKSKQMAGMREDISVYLIYEDREGTIRTFASSDVEDAIKLLDVEN
jgi:thiamine biosynthesis lipoprotein